MSVIDYRSPIIDSYMSAANPTVNYGTATGLAIGSGGKTSQAFRTLFRFNVSMIPAGATINAATLYWQVTDAAASAIASYIRRCTRPNEPTEAGITWNKYDGTNNWTTAGGDYTTTDQVSFNMPTATGEQEITGLLTLVQDALDNRSGILEIIAMSAAEGTAGDFTVASNEHGTEAYHPELEIEWTPASGNIARLSLSKDTFLGNDFPDANYGGETYLDIRKDVSRIRRSLLEADLIGGGVSGLIDEARLVVFSEIATGGSDFSAYELLRPDWVEMEATWNVYKTGGNWTTAGGDYNVGQAAAYASALKEGYWHDLLVAASLKTLVQNAVGGRLELLIKKVDETAADTSFFGSAETGGARKAPYLIVRWTPTPSLIIARHPVRAIIGR